MNDDPAATPDAYPPYYVRTQEATLAIWRVLSWLGRTGRVDTRGA